jgi:DNA-binding CsgD family transcriptional regulator
MNVTSVDAAPRQSLSHFRVDHPIHAVKPESVQNTSFKDTKFFPSSHNDLLQAVLESWVDGVLVLTEQGQWLQANQAAWQICQGVVPEGLWQACQMLIDSRSFYPDQPVIVETDLVVNHKTMRVRVRWFSVSETAQPYLLVVLEDAAQSKRNLAIAEVDRYHLSPREAEVWMLYRTGYRYKEIAQELYISLDTVKKHLKSIRVKQHDVTFDMNYDA